MGTKTGEKRASGTHGKDKAVESPAKRSKQEKQRKPKQTDYEVFMDQLEERQKQLSKVCVLLERPDLEEDEEGESVEPTMAQLQPLRRIYVPKKMHDYLDKVSSELDMVGRDSSDDPLRMLSTGDSYEMHAILKKHMSKVDKLLKAEDWEDAFCYWVGVLYAAKNDPNWYADSDAADDVVGIYKRLLKVWKVLRKKSEEELGGLASEVGAEETVKQQLQWYLQDLVDQMQEMGYDEIKDVPKL